MLYDYKITPDLSGRRHIELRQGYVGTVDIVDGSFTFEPPFNPERELGTLASQKLLLMLRSAFSGPLTIIAGHFPKIQ